MNQMGTANRETVERAEARRGYGDFASARNVGDTERALSAAAGALLVYGGLRRLSLKGLVVAGLGGMLLQRGRTGYCALYQRLGRNTAGSADGVRGNLGVKIERAIVVHAAPERVFRFWRNFTNLPRFMENLQSVEAHDPRRSHWVAKGPGGVPMAWDAEIINEIPNELIAWRSLGDATVAHAGSVRFEPGPGGRGTTVRVEFQYDPPGGSAAHAIAALFGADAGTRVDQDLQNLKRVIESGEAVA